MEKYLKYKQKYVNRIIGGSELEKQTCDSGESLVKATDKFCNISVGDRVVFFAKYKPTRSDDLIPHAGGDGIQLPDQDKGEFFNIKIGRVTDKSRDSKFPEHYMNIKISSSDMVVHTLNSEWHRNRVFKILST
jgi:hypothetical protein